MKELNETEMKEVEGGMMFDAIWWNMRICEFLAGFEDGYNESKR